MCVEVTFRTLNGSTFKLPAESSDTILEVKKKIAEHQSVSNHAGYRLFFKGKVLPDDDTVDSSGICAAPSCFVVVMPPRKLPLKYSPSTPTTKPDATGKPDPAAAAATPAASSENKPLITPEQTKSHTQEQSSTTQTSAEPASMPSPHQPNSLVSGSEYDRTVRQICDMGFPENDVKKALRASFNNPERAVEFLFNGIPESPQGPSPTASAAAPLRQHLPAATAPRNSTAPRTSETAGTPFNMFEAPLSEPAQVSGGGSDDLSILRSVPRFNVMRRLIQSNPAVLPQILQRLESMNPQLMAIIDANQEEFTRLINEPLPENEEGEADAVNDLSQTIAGAGGSTIRQSEQGEILVTEEEHQQIGRLTELASNIGIQRDQVLETWLACNRDETLTANFLVDHADELIADQIQSGAAANQGGNDGGARDPSGTGGPSA